ncbi:hypothetical protein EXN66_Car003834 [Channa argus]|uniref:Uncharacterized protein n=1 Tax=Channa argus TaxID=215402 RepID=A0A6G1PD43_CHAAH|nr:hypothetical protein EXN66_Car003834 [Channa argus]
MMTEASATFPKQRTFRNSEEVSQSRWIRPVKHVAIKQAFILVKRVGRDEEAVKFCQTSLGRLAAERSARFASDFHHQVFPIHFPSVQEERRRHETVGRKESTPGHRTVWTNCDYPSAEFSTREQTCRSASSQTSERLLQQRLHNHNSPFFISFPTLNMAGSNRQDLTGSVFCWKSDNKKLMRRRIYTSTSSGLREQPNGL